MVTSRIEGFYRKSIAQRLETIGATGLLSQESKRHLHQGGGLAVEVADRMSENVVCSHGLPLSVALNFRVNQKDVLVPMAVEEPSIVAAASNAARLVRISGGFTGEASPSVMTAQIQLDDVPAPNRVFAKIEARRSELLAQADRSVPNLVARGGGCRDLDVRVLDEASGLVVVHFYVDVVDAMGANLVDTIAEAVAPSIRDIVGGSIGLRILSNLPLRRMVTVRAAVSDEAVGGTELASAIARASFFAEKDVFRAVTHNKGIMNGIDAVAVALGQDWRAIEAGAHAFAAIDGSYRPLATWKRTTDGLDGTLTLPLAMATVGGSVRAHEGVRAAFELVHVESARELSIIAASAGLACNLAALRALAGEGIQKGHMKLHGRKVDAKAERTRELARARES